jgi:hypothetical protein
MDDDVNILRANTDTVKKNKDPVTDAGNKVTLEVNAEKSKLCVAVVSPECRAKS